MIVNYKDELAVLLLKKDGPEDASLTYSMPESRFRKHSEKFNRCLMEVYEKHSIHGALMMHVILSLREYFDPKWLADNVLDRKVMNLMEEEARKEYNIKEKKNVPAPKRGKK